MVMEVVQTEKMIGGDGSGGNRGGSGNGKTGGSPDGGKDRETDEDSGGGKRD